MWQKMLEESVEKHGEMSEEAGELYLKYGDALLRKCEESDEVFGGDEDDDANVAFEVLEVARLIFKGGLKQAYVLLRLGDLEKMNGHAREAVEDYEKCLRIRSELLEETDRRIADVHWCLAAAYETLRVEEEEQKDLAREKALEHYSLCSKSLSRRASTLKEDDPERKELEDILVELKETIEAPTPEETEAKAFASSAAAKVTILQPKRKPTTTTSTTTQKKARNI